MKKKKILYVAIALFCMVLLVVLLQQCNHEDLTEFVIAEVSEITYDELLSPPYAAEGTWSFVDLWNIECNGNYLDPTLAENNLYIEIADGLREILHGEVLHTYIPQEKIRSYDKHVKELLWETENRLLFLQIAAGTLSSMGNNEYDLKPTLVRIYAFDDIRCYLTIGYRNDLEINANHYVFYTEDPELVEELFTFAETMATRTKQ